VVERDQLMRWLYQALAAIPGITPPAIPDYQEVFSCWMAGFSLTPGAFDCSAETFAAELHELGLLGAGMARYYLMAASALFLQRQAASQTYPFSLPPASRTYTYRAEDYPNANAVLDTFVRWIVSDRYTQAHCQLIVDFVRTVADRHRR
jgi:dTDP-4-amino-4,6-dideoxygalactose transaminase